MADLPELGQISELIGKIYDASLDRRLWNSFLERLAHTFGSHQALLLNVDSVPRPGGFITTVGMDMAVVAKWEGSKEHVDVWYQGVQTKRRDMSYFGPDLCTDRVLHRSAFYADSLRALDIEHTLGGISVESDQRNWVFTIFRSGSVGPFSEQQKALYELLIPHFGRAIRISRMLARSDASNLALTDALEQSPFGIVVLDGLCNVLWANRRASGILVACDGITVRYGHVRFWEYGSQQSFDQSVQQALRTANHQGMSAGQVLTAPRPSGQRPYQLLICPVNQRPDAPPFVDDAACLILIHDPEEPKFISTDLLKKLYGLSSAEARLCVALFETGSLSDALETLQISCNTAKTHLAHIFQKVGVSSQGQLLQQLALGFRSASIQRGP